MARRRHLREHVNDHQLEIVAALREVNRVIEVRDASEIVAAIEEAISRKGEGSVAAGEGLVHALQQEVASVVPKRRWWARALRQCGDTRKTSSMTLAVIETHPVQYHAPVYQTLQREFGVPVSALYGSDFSVRGSIDREFGTEVRWDSDLLSGYASTFLGHAAEPPSTESFRTFLRELEAIKPKAILLTGYSSNFHRKAALAAFACRVPVIFRAETTDHARHRSFAQDAGRSLALRSFYAACSVVCPIGERSFAHYRRLRVPENKMVASRYCVNTSPFQLEDPEQQTRIRLRNELGISHDAFVFLYSGKLSERKGVEDLAYAAIALKCHVIFLGDGDQRQMLEALPSEHRFHFVGFKNQSELSPYFHAADALVLPSRRSETWGLVVNEALHHGKPVVVSDVVGSTLDLVRPGVTGEIFAAGNTSQLRSAMDRVMRWAMVSSVAKQCTDRVVAYTVQEAARGLRDAFERATGCVLPSVP